MLDELGVLVRHLCGLEQQVEPQCQHQSELHQHGGDLAVALWVGRRRLQQGENHHEQQADRESREDGERNAHDTRGLVDGLVEENVQRMDV